MQNITFHPPQENQNIQYVYPLPQQGPYFQVSNNNIVPPNQVFVYSPYQMPLENYNGYFQMCSPDQPQNQQKQQAIQIPLSAPPQMIAYFPNQQAPGPIYTLPYFNQYPNSYYPPQCFRNYQDYMGNNSFNSKSVKYEHQDCNNKLNSEKIHGKTIKKNVEKNSSFNQKNYNPKRNTIKNIGNQIISYITGKQGLELLNKINTTKQFEGLDISDFIQYVSQFKNGILKIADLRNIWNCLSEDKKQNLYNKIIRILSRKYLNTEAKVRILNSKKMKDKFTHLQIRRVLQLKLGDPENFVNLIH